MSRRKKKNRITDSVEVNCHQIEQQRNKVSDLYWTINFRTMDISEFLFWRNKLTFEF